MRLFTALLICLLIVSGAFCDLWEVGRVPVPGGDNCRTVRAYGDYFFTNIYPQRLILGDVHNPSQPILLTNIFVPFTGYCTVAENTFYYTGGRSTYCFHIINLSDLPNINYVGSSVGTFDAVDIEARGDYLFVTDNQYNSLLVFDISDRQNPVLLNRLHGMGNIYGLKLSENFLYLGIHNQGLRIYDISNPEDPQFISSLYVPCSLYPMLTKDGNYVYFASYTQGFCVIDVGNPYMPFIAYSRNPFSLDRYVEVANDRAFCGCWTQGIKMSDITTPNNPLFLIQIPSLSTGTFDVHVAGRHLFVADLGYLRVMEYIDEGDGYYHWTRARFYWHDDVRVFGQWWPSFANQFTDPIPIGFTFPFYDNLYDTLYICPNGFIAFNNYSPSYWNTPIPCDTQPNDIIAPFWDRFDPTGKPRHIYTRLYHHPTRFVIEFNEMPRPGTIEYETFQVILFPNGNIVFQYPDVMNPSSATVGLENETGTRGTMIAHNYSRNVPDSVGIAFIRHDARGSSLPVEEIITLQKENADFDFSASPNPFNSETVIRYALNNPAEVSLEAYDVLGRMAGRIYEGGQDAGVHTANWNPQGLTSGLYFIRLRAGGYEKIIRALYMK